MVTGKRKNALAAEIAAHAHQILSGVSEKNGGLDEGPNPHELLEAALAACTIITAQMYANRKGLKLESTDITVRILAEGAETRISREVTYRGELTPEQRTRLTQILDMCPIHKLLESDVKIETTVLQG